MHSSAAELVIHSAHYPAEMKMEIGDKLKYAGFGLPASSNKILYNDKYETTLILQDTLEKGHFIEILDFPYPQSMVDENGYLYGNIQVTLVSKPMLNASQGAEYCQSNIKVMFGTYDSKTLRDTSKRNIKNQSVLKDAKICSDHLYMEQKHIEIPTRHMHPNECW